MDPNVTRYFQQSNQSNEFVEKIFSLLMEKQESINRQLEIVEKKYNQRMEENNRLVEESTQNVLQQIEGKNRQLEVIDSKISQQLKNNRYGSDDEQEETPKRRRKNKKSGSSALGADDAVIELFRKKGYAIHGAIVGEKFSDEEKQEILQAGFFLIEQYGKSFILNTPDEFVPKKM